MRTQDGIPYAMRIDGVVWNRRDLPSPQTERWITRKKKLVVCAFNCGLMTEDELLQRYRGLSADELRAWVAAYRSHGESGSVQPNTEPLPTQRGEPQRNMQPATSDTVSACGLSMTSAGVVFGEVDGEMREVRLTKAQRRLLGYLMMAPGTVRSKEALLEFLYGWDQPEPKIIDVMVANIRSKLKFVFGKRLIKTSWGRGYYVPAQE